ncbi:MAG: ImmA/IrrE family metallo-endopeptidase [Phycisphaeraceae bacterium]|nr:ImmA/IrrE family metallo-endopeptidase [Phycisphaeraceae bacterium]
MATGESPILRLRPSVKRVESAAWRTLQDCRERLGLDRLPVPVPVEHWIEHPLGYRFGVVRLEKGILGQAFIKDREILVSDRISHEGRFRFTCAHELGHQVLHRSRRGAYTDANVMHSGPKQRVEWEADRFAAAFLMPIPLVIEHLFLLRDELGVPREQMATLLQSGEASLSLWRDTFLPAIAARFGVSRESAVYRFGEIELIDGSPFMVHEHRPRLLAGRPRPGARAGGEPSLFQ